MKRIIILTILLIATPAFADYTLDLKNGSGTVVKTYTITANQIAHLQKKATRTGVSVLDQFESVIARLIKRVKNENISAWHTDNEAYIEEQSRQP